MSSGRYIVVNHTYEGLAGERTDWIERFVRLEFAIDYFEHRKEHASSYLDSSVMLIDLQNERIVKSYYAFESND